MSNETLNWILLVVNSIAAFAAVAGTIVAIVIYVLSSRQQEKAINYSLLESRIKLLRYFEYEIHQTESLVQRIIEGRDWEIEKFKFLFSDNIVSEYDAIQEECRELGDLLSEIDRIERNSLPIAIDSKGKVDDDIWEKHTHLVHNRKALISENPTAEKLEEFRVICKQTLCENVCNNYFLKVSQYIERQTELTKRNTVFLTNMKNEISTNLHSK